MLLSVEEFIRLRTSDVKAEQHRASHDNADDTIWLDIIQNFPEYKFWVIHNKTISLNILELLARDTDAEVRAAVARKRKINDNIFTLLSLDESAEVRHALLCNTKLSKRMKGQIFTGDSEWLTQALHDQLLRNE
jgi:hypothetical protein